MTWISAAKQASKPVSWKKPVLGIPLIVGAVLCWWLVQIQHISMALFTVASILLLAWWQHSRVKAVLTDDHVRLDPEKVTRSQTNSIKENLRFWGIRFFGLLAIFCGILFGEAWWWVKQNEMPLDYTLRQPLWRMGIATTPKLVEIPKGSFVMGCQSGECSNSTELPTRTVNIATGFQMSATEVTFAEYDYYIWSIQQTYGASTSSAETEKPEEGSPYPTFPEDLGIRKKEDSQDWERAKHPVINLNWKEAKSYAEWLSGETGLAWCRLPTEAEWEYAARAGTKTEYFWGDKIGKNNASCDGCRSQWDNKQTAPVKSFSPNAWGLHDMHGNVWEWVEDCWHKNYQEAPKDGSAWVTNCSSDSRVLRGGSWGDDPGYLRSADRGRYGPGVRDWYGGFRVVCSLPSSGL